MPELPEVEIVRRGLEAIVVGKSIARIELLRADLRGPIPRDLPERFRGQKITALRRRAKFILWDTPAGTILNHLGMTGGWREMETGRELKHDHCYLHLSDGKRLAYRDPRRFGLIDYFTDSASEQKKLGHLGVEPLDEKSFTAEFLWRIFRGRTAPIKNLIMDQRVVVGVGNIYAAEALFAAGIRPHRAAGRLKLPSLENLVGSVQRVLSSSIRAGGSSISDFLDFHGDQGHFQQHFQVYDRAGELCFRCRSKLQSMILGGRTTVWCSNCQK